MGVKEAYNKPNAAKLALLIQVKVFDVIPDLIKHLSGEFDHVNMNFVDKLISLRNNLLTMSRETGATITLTSILNSDDTFKEFDESRKQKMIIDHIGCLRLAADEGYKSFLKHIEPNLPMYILRRRFHISHKPNEGPTSADSEFWLSDGMKFFGCSADEYNIEMINQWFEYKEEWNTLAAQDPEWFKDESNYHFWNTRQYRWPDLVHSALWYSNWPTSSIAAERAFALGRIIDSAQRGRQSWDTFAREVKLKANTGILQKMLSQQLELIGKLTKPK